MARIATPARVVVAVGGCLAATFWFGGSARPAPRPADALAALSDAGLLVQRERPEGEPGGDPRAHWVTAVPRDWQELDGLSKTALGRPAWSGVAWLKESPMDDCRDFFRMPNYEGCWLDYRSFYICGDPELLREVRRVLAARGFRPAGDP
jgi:hypothetical protein